MKLYRRIASSVFIGRKPTVAEMNDLMLGVAPPLALLIAASLVYPYVPGPDKLADVIGTPDPQQTRLAVVVKAGNQLPNNVELAKLPPEQWMKPTFIRMNEDELRGFVMNGTEKIVIAGEEKDRPVTILAAAVSDKQKLLTLVDPNGECEKDRILLARIKSIEFTPHHPKGMRSLGEDAKKKFCLLSEKTSPAPQPPAGTPSAISIAPPEIKWRGEWSLPPVTLNPPKIKQEPDPWVVAGPRIDIKPPLIEVKPSAVEKPLPFAFKADFQGQLLLGVDPSKHSPTCRQPSQTISLADYCPRTPAHLPPSLPSDITWIGAVFFEHACPDKNANDSRACDPDETSLPPGWSQPLDYDAIVKKAADDLKDSDKLIFVVGSADRSGEGRYDNLDLSKRRAEKIINGILDKACESEGPRCRIRKESRVILHAVGTMPGRAGDPDKQPQHRRAEVFSYTRR